MRCAEAEAEGLRADIKALAAPSDAATIDLGWLRGFHEQHFGSSYQAAAADAAEAAPVAATNFLSPTQRESSGGLVFWHGVHSLQNAWAALLNSLAVIGREALRLLSGQSADQGGHRWGTILGCKAQDVSSVLPTCMHSSWCLQRGAAICGTEHQSWLSGEQWRVMQGMRMRMPYSRPCSSGLPSACGLRGTPSGS